MFPPVVSGRRCTAVVPIRTRGDPASVRSAPLQPADIPRPLVVVLVLFLASLLLLLAAAPADAQGRGHRKGHGDRDRRFEPILVIDQGSFLVGGTVIDSPGMFDPFNATPAGQTFHGDHAYVQYQVPAKPRKLPLVMWHGGGQFSKTWETTPDGREGFQTIFLRRGWPVYLFDQPRRGRAGRSTEGITITPTPGEQELFNVFRLGLWPDFFPGVQFPRDSASLDQYYRQQTPNTGPTDNEVLVSAVSALFDSVGPAILLTHSASGPPGWLTAIRSPNVRALVTYEPVGFVFPEDDLPPAIGTIEPIPVSGEEFERLTRIPVQVVFGDFIPEEPSPYPGPERWRGRLLMAEQFVEALNSRGGDAELLHLPDVGVFGNTHFPFSDLNNRVIADLLSQWLREKDLDDRERKHRRSRHDR